MGTQGTIAKTAVGVFTHFNFADQMGKKWYCIIVVNSISVTVKKAECFSWGLSILT